MNPAEQLTGRALDGGWTVGDRVPLSPTATGGRFSCCYAVSSVDGREAFLKALDFSKAFSAPDPSRVLQAMTEAFNFERDLLAACREQAMDRVVRVLADGQLTIPGGTAGGVVQYLIFEPAIADVRIHLSSLHIEVAWKLRCLHHVSTGLRQLHRANIAHQDLKPSNVLVFDNQVSKVGDLGRAVRKGLSSPHEGCECAGDMSYGPPELLYGQPPSDWGSRRLGCDAYLLGSMVVFFFTGLSTTSMLMDELHPDHHWTVWGGTYNEVLPYVRLAFNNVIDRFASSVPGDYLRAQLKEIVRQLCEPEPSLRGDPLKRNQGANPLSLERYLARFNLLARRAEAGLFREGS